MSEKTEARFTPGPWAINPDEYGIEFQIEGGDARLADVFDIRANAHLIAAAPDLYAALEALLENNLGPQVDDGGAWDSCCDMARSALAKARGEA